MNDKSSLNEMKSIIIQIYEVQTPSEAEPLIDMGVDHIGSVILSAGEWKVPLIKETIDLTQTNHSKSSLIPLFSQEDMIFRTLDYYRPDIVHFCEALPDTRDDIQKMKRLIRLQNNVRDRFPDIRIMRSIPIPPATTSNIDGVFEIAEMFEPVSDYFLTDTVLMKGEGSSGKQPVDGFVGITGQTCDWEIAAGLVQRSGIPVILAGGISENNVFDGILQVRPAGVDSCTRTNAMDSTGRPVRFKKDLDKVKRFVKEVRRASEFINCY
jgi:phosphoribosylanthranilate isomerase